MVRLLLVEMRRDLARRTTRLLVLAFVFATLAVIGISLITVDPASDAAIRARNDRAVEGCVYGLTDGRFGDTGDAYGSFGYGPAGEEMGYDRFGNPIVDGPTEVGEIDESDARAACEAQLQRITSGEIQEHDQWNDPEKYAGSLEGREVTVSPSSFSLDGDEPLRATDWWDAEDQGSSGLFGIVPLMLIVAFGAGASMIGAEWKAGTVGTQLVWEPRRWRVWAAKFTASVVLASVIAFVLFAYVLVVTWPLYLINGTTAGVDGEWMSGLLGGMLKYSALAGLGAGFGASLAMIGRSTAGGILVMFGYLAVAESFLRSWEITRDLQGWLLLDNLFTVFWGHSPDETVFVRGAVAAFVTLAAYLGAMALVAGILFERRDVAGAS